MGRSWFIISQGEARRRSGAIDVLQALLQSGCSADLIRQESPSRCSFLDQGICPGKTLIWTCSQPTSSEQPGSRLRLVKLGYSGVDQMFSDAARSATCRSRRTGCHLGDSVAALRMLEGIDRDHEGSASCSLSNVGDRRSACDLRTPTASTLTILHRSDHHSLLR